MEKAVDLKKNSPQSDDEEKRPTQNPKNNPVSEGKGKGSKGKSKSKSKGHRAAADDDKKEAPTGDDGAVPASGSRAEKGNAGNQNPPKKRAREAAGEGSRGGRVVNNQGGGGSGDENPFAAEEPVELTSRRCESCGRVFGSSQALSQHATLHIKRPIPVLRKGKSSSSSSSSSSAPLVSMPELLRVERAGEAEKAAQADDNKRGVVGGGAANAEGANKGGSKVEIDLNAKQFLLPDLNLPPPEY